MHCFAFGVQVPVQLPVAQTNMQVWLLPQLPAASQVCAMFGLPGSHRLVLGTQLPLHMAPLHTKGQVDQLLIQLPVESQTCGWLPLHRVVVGAHGVHAPATQATPHIVVFVQLPVASQVCAVLPMHRFDPGEQTPVQLPAPVHTLGQAAPLCHWPLASQVCGTVPTHCFALGAQTPVQRGVLFVQTNPHAAPSFW